MSYFPPIVYIQSDNSTTLQTIASFSTIIKLLSKSSTIETFVDYDELDKNWEKCSDVNDCKIFIEH